MSMLHTAEIDMANSVKPSDINIFLSDTAWAICSYYHTVLKASPGAAIFGQDMLFDIQFIGDWKKIGLCYFPGGHRTFRKYDKPLFYNACNIYFY